jgi:hypothetical protein
MPEFQSSVTLDIVSVRLTLTPGAGAVVDAEGAEDVQRLLDLVERLSGSLELTGTAGEARATASPPQELVPSEPLDLRALLSADLQERIVNAEPTSDQELAVVLAKAAVDYGMRGLDRRSVEPLAALAKVRRKNWRGTLSNASMSGLLESRDGVWVPTRAGLRRISSRTPRRNGRRSSPD